MGVSVLQIDRIKKISFGITMFIILVLIAAAGIAYGADTPGIDDDTVITVEQAGSLAPSEGNYGWDSRGATFRYYARNGKVAGNLGTVMFCDRSGIRRPFLWDEWGMEFPDWWGKMLAEKIRNEAGDDKIPAIREAFAEYVTFECEWIIAIGTKSSSAGNRLYKTLRSDGTLRVMKTQNLDDGSPAEELFAGNAMAGSLSRILKNETWGDGSQSTFAQRNPYYYDVRIRSFDVDIRTTNCTICAAKGCKSGSSECTHVPKGTYINIPVPIVYNGVSYSGAKSFVWEGQTVSFYEPVIEGYIRKSRDDDLSGLEGKISGNSITPTGNTRIFLAYDALASAEKLNDLTIKYVILKESGNSVKETVKEIILRDYIAQGSEFKMALDKTISADGATYYLIPGVQTGLSYASNHKFANAVKGINAYRITASDIHSDKITYATETAYKEDKPGLLYVPVCENETYSTNHTPVDDTPPGGNTGNTGNSPDAGASTNFGSGYTGTGLVRKSEDPAASIRILSDTFDVSTAIPSTEDVYIRAEFANYMYSLDAAVISGSYPIRVTVDFPYELRWTETDEEGKTEEKIEYGNNTASVTVYRDYSFIHLNSFAYYVPDSVMIDNKALDPQSITITAAQAGISAPSCTQPRVYGGSRIGGNIDLPIGCPVSLSASLTVIEGGEERPGVPSADTAAAQSIAEAAVGQMRCRNDELSFDGRSILGTAGWHSYTGMATADTSALSPGRSVIDSRSVLGSKFISIPALTRNGQYPATARLVTYKPEITYGGGTISYNPVTAVNPIAVHTPTICELQISDCDPAVSNIRFNQELGNVDTSAFQVVIGKSTSYGMNQHEFDSCDFWLYVNNSGNHPVYAEKLGSGYNYSVNKSGLNGGSFILCNEVFLPFDVYMDIFNDWDTSNDKLLTGGSWYVVSGKQRYYIPDHVTEGDYCIEARTRAVNSRSRVDLVTNSQKNGLRYLYANEKLSDYVTADSVRVHVSGKMFGFALTGIDSDAEWRDIFETGGVSKLRASGLKDGTLLSVLPQGKTAKDKLKDYYFYYSAGSCNELGLKTGRHSKFVLPMLAGCNPNSSMQNSGLPKAGYTWNYQLYTTGSRMASKAAYIIVEPRFRWEALDGKSSGTYENTKVIYSETVGGVLRRDREPVKSIKISAHSEPEVGNDRLRLWEFSYSLPSKYRVTLNGRLVKDGYLIVNMKITAYNSAGEAIMSYNAVESDGYCNMWMLEGQELSRIDFYGKSFEFRYGDVMILNLGESKGDDYEIDFKY